MSRIMKVEQGCESKRVTTRSGGRGHTETVKVQTSRPVKISQRGRPPKCKQAPRPQNTQQQYTPALMDFLKVYCDLNLEKNFIWRSNFDMQGLNIPISLQLPDQKDQSLMSNIVFNIYNIMEKECAQEFQDLCVKIYYFFKNKDSLTNIQNKILYQVESSESLYSFLNLRNSLIPEKCREAGSSRIRQFVREICVLVYTTLET